jgi:hypothetical protein
VPDLPVTGDRFRLVFDCYSEFIAHQFERPRVVEIGSHDVNGSIGAACPVSFEYVGVDFAEGKGVDVVLDDPYRLPLEFESMDVVVSSSCGGSSQVDPDLNDHCKPDQIAPY